MTMKIKKLINYISILVGLAIFSGFIWLRFIRERFPRDIPFNLSLLGFIILIEIISIYGYILFTMFKEPKYDLFTKLIHDMIDWLYKPLIAFDNFIKDLSGVQSRYLRFMVCISYKCIFIFKNTSIFYVIFYILPRLVLVTALFIDTFYLHKLYYLYKVLLIGILLFLHRYIMYSFKHAKELLILHEEPYVSSFTVKYVPEIAHQVAVELYGENYAEDEDEEDKDDIPPTMCLPLRRFIEYQTHAIVYENHIHSILSSHTHKYWNEVRIKYHLKPEERIPGTIMNKLILEDKQIENIVQISLILEYYNIAVSDSKYKTLKKLITANYLQSWLYILLVSSNIVLWMNLLDIMSIYVYMEEPFSGVILEKIGDKEIIQDYIYIIGILLLGYIVELSEDIISIILSIRNIEEVFSGIPVVGILVVPDWYTAHNAFADIIIWGIVPIIIVFMFYVIYRYLDDDG